MKKIALIGSTGSVGTQTLNIIQQHSDKFSIEILTAYNNADLLIKQAIQFQPNVVVIGNEAKYEVVRDALQSHPIKVYARNSSIEQIVEMDSFDQIVFAIPGMGALTPLLKAIKANKNIAVANKEAIVSAGKLIMSALANSKSRFIPIDSEHSAIFQCLIGETSPIKKLYLTASGGPFLNISDSALKNVKPAEALQHPIWNMGKKVSIDSASLMNKGMEAIEAFWFYELKPEQIEVLIHPQAIVHSMVEFFDGSFKAQLSEPDMRIPIQYALSFPDRLINSKTSINPLSFPDLNFEAPDFEKFRNLALAFETLKIGGNSSCVLNASNEVAVEAFINSRIGFLQIPKIVERCLERIDWIKNPNLNDYLETDHQTKMLAEQFIQELNS